MLLWSVWNSRNQAVFRGVSVPPSHSIAQVSSLLAEYQSVIVFRDPALRRNVRCRGPPDGSFKINADAAIIEGECCGLGMVLRYHEGEVLMSCASCLNFFLSPEDAVVEAVCYGVIRAKKAGSRISNILKEIDESAVM
ncbi:hypothetical protein GH714_025776 [Hevea brasiliensis]|uniref:RNase H type-1 domain-containing protein n=1 Tax=Hevea brasiliensis TaxID=3981 RepID=A0A6A6KCU1_HEVBR|nr:hypothetical protein GH714_025776 [Hevea brasiliensis]